jgi:hypothetical protein
MELANNWMDRSDVLTKSLSDMAAEYKLSTETLKEIYGAKSNGERTAALRAYADSTVYAAAQIKEYQQTFNAAAEKFIHAWDQTETNEYTQKKFDAISDVLNMVASFGLGAAATGLFIAMDFSKALAGRGGKFWKTVAGDGFDYIATWQSVQIPVFRDLSSRNPVDASNELANWHQFGLDRVGFLAERFNKWVDEYNKREDRDSGWYIPTV